MVERIAAVSAVARNPRSGVSLSWEEILAQFAKDKVSKGEKEAFVNLVRNKLVRAENNGKIEVKLEMEFQVRPQEAQDSAGFGRAIEWNCLADSGAIGFDGILIGTNHVEELLSHCDRQDLCVPLSAPDCGFRSFGGGELQVGGMCGIRLRQSAAQRLQSRIARSRKRGGRDKWNGRAKELFTRVYVVEGEVPQPVMSLELMSRLGLTVNFGTRRVYMNALSDRPSELQEVRNISEEQARVLLAVARSLHPLSNTEEEEEKTEDSGEQPPGWRSWVDSDGRTHTLVTGFTGAAGREEQQHAEDGQWDPIDDPLELAAAIIEKRRQEKVKDMETASTKGGVDGRPTGNSARSAHRASRLDEVQVGSTLVENEIVRVAQTLLPHKDVFETHRSDGSKAQIDESISTVRLPLKEEAKNVVIKPRRMRLRGLDVDFMLETIDEMVKQGFARYVNESEASHIISPAFVVTQKQKRRMVVDFVELNKYLKKTPYAGPTVQECIDWVNERISSMKRHARKAAADGKERRVYYTVADVPRAYYMLRLDEESARAARIQVAHQVVELNCLTLGLQSAPWHWQSFLVRVLGDLYMHECFAYMDDLIICTYGTLDEHLSEVDKVLARLNEFGVKLKASKTLVAADEVICLSHRFTQDGICAPRDRVEAIAKMLPPTTKKEMESFLGTIAYYRRYIRNCSIIARPLHEMTKKQEGQKTSFVSRWGEEQQRAFEQLKEALMEEVVLHTPDYEAPFKICTDASDTAWGACLLQEQERTTENGAVTKVWLPLAYKSGSFSPAERNWATWEQEVAAVLYGAEAFSYYYAYSPFTTQLHTDHLNIPALLDTSNMSKQRAERVTRWALRFMALAPLELVYLPGEENVDADMASRMPMDERKEVVPQRLGPAGPSAAVLAVQGSTELDGFHSLARALCCREMGAEVAGELHNGEPVAEIIREAQVNFIRKFKRVIPVRKEIVEAQLADLKS